MPPTLSYPNEELKKEAGLPRIESDYDAAGIGPLRTRIETFVETIKKG